MPILSAKTAICNHALDLIGAGFDDCEILDSYENDTGRTADWFRARFDAEKRRVLLSCDWPEAIIRLPGADAGGDVDGIEHEPYDYAYLVPTTVTVNGTTYGVLALRGIVTEDDATGAPEPLEYRLEGAYIHTDYATTDFTWKLLLDLDAGFSVPLADCLAYALAIRGATKFLKGKAGDDKRRLLMEEYQQVIFPSAVGAAAAATDDWRERQRDTPIAEIT